MTHKSDAEAWYLRYHNRQETGHIDVQKLVNLLLDQLWQHECQIISDWMPNHPRPETTPITAIRHYADGSHQFLRYSKGPLQGYFWDSYPDDMHSPELALIVLSRAPAPLNAKCVATHGK